MFIMKCQGHDGKRAITESARQTLAHVAVLQADTRAVVETRTLGTVVPRLVARQPRVA